MSVARLVKAVLYEGYALYPYRPSALKNQRRFAFGAIYPRAWAERTLEPSQLRAEVVAIGAAGTVIDATVSFLRLARGGGAHEESIALAPVTLGDAATAHTERVDRDGLVLELESTSAPAGDDLWRFAIEIRNLTPISCADHEAVMDHVPASTHAVLRIARGELVSSIDPPARAVAAVAGCRSSGLYPIVVASGVVLASPIILPDFPEIAPESPGDFFDGTEMDEMLTLRVLTMTDAEKREASSDPRIAAMLARTEDLGFEATARLHGVVRTPWPSAGTRVRVRPDRERRADAFDVLLAGKLATVATVERDLEGRVYCAVTIDDDPGADLGARGLPGHRFFFAPDELEVIA